jgi:hypothetical protein
VRNQEAFEIWAPDGALWSPWAKPVLFVQSELHAPSTIEPPAIAPEEIPVDASWAPDASSRTALVLDLPGPKSVHVALALLDRGYRPVPLFNASPGPLPVVPVEPLREAIFHACDRLARASLREDAPPAFLLDRDRRGVITPMPGRFDNRWMTFPQDFPSANFLQSHGIESVLFVSIAGERLPDDLAHVFFRWKEAGMSFARKDLDGGPIVPLDVSRPSGFKAAWYRALVVLGLKRSSAGGFGSVVPTPSQGGGGGFM